jgi:acyl-CoA-binding protein
MSNTIDKEFDAAVQLITKGPAPGVKAPKIEPSNEQKLEFYALFKQATVGPNNTKPPGRLDLINRAKWTAWKNVAKLSKTEAKKKYVELVAKQQSNWKELAGYKEDKPAQAKAKL